MSATATTFSRQVRQMRDGLARLRGEGAAIIDWRARRKGARL